MVSLPRRIYNRINHELAKLSTSGRQIYASTWKPYSRLITVGDKAGWSIDWDVYWISQIARQIGIHVVDAAWQDLSSNQSVFFADQFFLLNDTWLNKSHRIGFPYFHGMPNTREGVFDQIYASIIRNHQRISRIQASHTEMRDVILQTGIDSEKVFLIPIGVNLDFFPLLNRETKTRARQKLGIPQSAFVIGSFQKDGNGWGEGLEPKLVKGPDVFLSVIKKLKAHIPELYVLLSGPARGYVKAGLESSGVPYSHHYLNSYPDIGGLFQALDLYLITSRQEGGPKAVLESMASGVPLVSTRVGQAMDLVRHGANGWLTGAEDDEALADWARHVYGLPQADLETLIGQGRLTAEANSYTAQVSLWRKFMAGFVA